MYDAAFHGRLYFLFEDVLVVADAFQIFRELVRIPHVAWDI
jgi:hypothetical protein